MVRRYARTVYTYGLVLVVCPAAIVVVYTQKYLPTYLPACLPTYLPTYLPACMHACMHWDGGSYLRNTPQQTSVTIFSCFEPRRLNLQRLHLSLRVNAKVVGEERLDREGHVDSFLASFFWGEERSARFS